MTSGLPAGMIGVSPKAVFVGPTATGEATATSIPSIDSSKSMASVLGENATPGACTSPGAPLLMVWAGATRSTPSTTGAGGVLPAETTVTVGRVSSVVLNPADPGK